MFMKIPNLVNIMGLHGEGNGNPLQYSCLGNPMNRGAWQATVHGAVGVRQDLVTEPPPTVGLQASDE